MRPVMLACLALAACATADTPPDAWVFRPPEGQPSMIEAFSEAYQADPIGTAHSVGQLLGLIGALVLTLSGVIR